MYQHSPTAEKYFVESVPGGVAVFDYNGDGRPDIFFTNGAKTPALDKVSPIYSNRLYRNDGGMRFTDVTNAAGLAGAGYAMGQPPATSTTTATSISSSPALAPISSIAIAATDDSRTSPGPRASPPASSASAAAGSITTTTAGSISSS